MTTPSRNRLVRDYKRLKDDPPEGISASPNPCNIMFWNAVIFGPEDTPWESGTFKLSLEFSEDYPNRAPVVKFISKMFHPNIYQDGSICLDILQKQWSPIYDVWAILTSVQSLLTDPNPNSPANQEAAKLFSENKKDYLQQVQACVERSWMETACELDEEDKKEASISETEMEPAEDKDRVESPLGKRLVKGVKRDQELELPDSEVHRHKCDDTEEKVCKRLKCEEA